MAGIGAHQDAVTARKAASASASASASAYASASAWVTDGDARSPDNVRTTQYTLELGMHSLQ
jgi:hypothetical protein